MRLQDKEYIQIGHQEPRIPKLIHPKCSLQSRIIARQNSTGHPQTFLA